MGRKTLKELYFSWLYSLVSHKRLKYLKLCDLLHQKKFRWFIHNDDNRCEDGLNLRSSFIELNNFDESHLEVNYFLKGDCSVFELLVALSQRINDIMYDLDSKSDKTSRWFFEMIENLGLEKFTDDLTSGDRLDPVSEAEINEKLEVFIERSYDFYGRGGLFPLKRRPPEDQASTEIWYQLMRYLDENYG